MITKVKESKIAVGSFYAIVRDSRITRLDPIRAGCHPMIERLKPEDLKQYILFLEEVLEAMEPTTGEK